MAKFQPLRFGALLLVLLSFLGNSVFFRSFECYDVAPEYDCVLGGTYEETPETVVDLVFKAITNDIPPTPSDLETEFLDDLSHFLKKTHFSPESICFSPHFFSQESLLILPFSPQRESSLEIYKKKSRLFSRQNITIRAFIPYARMYS